MAAFSPDRLASFFSLPAMRPRYFCLALLPPFLLLPAHRHLPRLPLPAVRVSCLFPFAVNITAWETGPYKWQVPVMTTEGADAFLLAHDLPAPALHPTLSLAFDIDDFAAFELHILKRPGAAQAYDAAAQARVRSFFSSVLCPLVHR